MFKKLIAKFAVARPQWAAMEEWDEWEQKAKAEHPFRFWLFDTVPLKLITFKRRTWNRAVDFVRYRTTRRMHVIKPRTLKPGYQPHSDIILHVTFDRLVRYVEDELGVRNLRFDGLYEKGKLAKFWQYRRPLSRKERIKGGLAHLEWELTDPDVPTRQRDVAKQFKALYLWWTVDRELRLNAWADEKLVGVQTEEDRIKADSNTKIFTLDVGESTRFFWDCASVLEEFYREQDSEMLAVLVKMRDDLD